LESDSSLAIVALAISLLVFAAVAASQAAFLLLGRRGSSSWSNGEAAPRSISGLVSRYERIAVLFSILRIASVLAIGISLAVWVLDQPGVTWGLAVLLAALVVVLLTLIWSVTRAIGRRYYRGILLVESPFLAGARWLFNPLLWAAERLGLSVQQWGRGEGSDDNGRSFSQEDAMSSFPVEDELREADPVERRMIQAILTLEDVLAREIMVPRVDIVAVEVDTPLTEVAALMSEGGHSRLPVYQDNIDNVVGIVHARDVLRNMTDQNGNVSLADIARPASFIPDSKPLDELLRDFQERRVTIAIVVDEYGGTEGVITVEDLLEEIVGEIEDEFEREEPTIVRLSEKETIVDGRVTLDELNELFRTSLEGDGFDTVGGLLSTHLGKIPIAGDTVSLEDITMRVLSTSGRRVRKVLLVHQ